MKFLFTDSHSMSDWLVQQGHDVYVESIHDYLEDEEPEIGDYPLKGLLRKHNPDILVCVGPEVPVGDRFIGYHKGVVVPWLGQVSGRISICITDKDPELYDSSRRRMRQCTARRGDFTICATNSTKCFRSVSVDTRCVLVDDDSGDYSLVMLAIDNIKSRRDTQRMIYLPDEE